MPLPFKGLTTTYVGCHQVSSFYVVCVSTFRQTIIKLVVTWLVITQVQNKSFGLVAQLHQDIGVLCAITRIFAYWTSLVTVAHVVFFIVECGILRFLCAMRVCNVWASSSSLGYLCAKLCFCHTFHCCASQCRKNRTCTHSLSHRAYLMPRQPNFCFGTFPTWQRRQELKWMINSVRC